MVFDSPNTFFGTVVFPLSMRSYRHAQYRKLRSIPSLIGPRWNCVRRAGTSSHILTNKNQRMRPVVWRGYEHLARLPRILRYKQEQAGDVGSEHNAA